MHGQMLGEGMKKIGKSLEIGLFFYKFAIKNVNI